MHVIHAMHIILFDTSPLSSERMALATDLAPERTLQRCDVLNGHLEMEKMKIGGSGVIFCDFRSLRLKMPDTQTRQSRFVEQLSTVSLLQKGMEFQQLCQAANSGASSGDLGSVKELHWIFQ